MAPRMSSPLTQVPVSRGVPLVQRATRGGLRGREGSREWDPGLQQRRDRALGMPVPQGRPGRLRGCAFAGREGFLQGGGTGAASPALPSGLTLELKKRSTSS